MNDAAVPEIDTRLHDPLAACRAASCGIGFVGPDIPIEVLIASGRPFGHLPWRADHATPWADRWLESSFPYWARSILEQWHDGAFDAHETVVFSRADDASQRLYYYVRELRRSGRLRGPKPRIFDIALISRESSLAHTESALLDLMRSLDVDEAALPAAIERANALRRRITLIERGRGGNGPLYERLGRAALWTDPSEWIDSLRLPDTEPAATRLLLAGSMPPDERLHDAAEAAGASIVGEAHPLALGRLGPELGVASTHGSTDLHDEPVRALAKHVRALAKHVRAASIAPRAFVDRGAWIVDRARAAGATGVVIWLTREDEALAWTAPVQRRALEAAGVPVLLLAARRWQADDDAAERIAEFIRRCESATA